MAERADTLLLAVHAQRVKGDGGRAGGLVWGLARLGLSSDTLRLTECSELELGTWLARLAPAEVLHDGRTLPEAVLQARWALLIVRAGGVFLPHGDHLCACRISHATRLGVSLILVNKSPACKV